MKAIRIRIGIICNTGTSGKSHIREIGRTKTLCGQPVVIGNKCDDNLSMGDAECNRCRQIVGLPPLAPNKGK